MPTGALLGTPGVVVGSIIEGSGAEQAGLRVGDLIVAFNGTPIKGMADLAAAVRLSSPGDVVTVEFQREGETFTVDAALGVNSGQ